MPPNFLIQPQSVVSLSRTRSLVED
jgi:hypothetical protein